LAQRGLVLNKDDGVGLLKIPDLFRRHQPLRRSVSDESLNGFFSAKNQEPPVGQEDISVSEIQANTRISQVQENSKVAEAYLAAMRTRNVEALDNTLHPDLHVVGPSGETHNRASFLETMRNVVTHLESVDVAARLASGNQNFYMFNLVMAAPAAPLRTAQLLTHHEDGKIKKIEIIADKADFHTYLKNLNR
jgi:hypothetical protein